VIELYGFQKVAVAKLIEVTNGLNCDDMGLGKTVQGIAIDFAKRNRYKQLTGKAAPPTLIVAPSSALESPWETHLRRYWPTCKINMINPKRRQSFVNGIIDSFKNPQKQYFHYHIIHWEALRLIPELQKFLWFHVIADEVQRAKNRAAQQTRALKKINTMNKLGLSGTAADNMPEDLWSVLNWLYPRTWGSSNRFREHHVDYTTRTNYKTGKSYRVVSGVLHATDLHRAMSSFYIRRTKEDPSINLDLPEKTYSEIPVNLLPKQRRAYDAMRKDMLTWVGEREDQPLATPLVISQLIRLQQFAVAYGELVTIVRNIGEGNREFKQFKLRLTEPSAKLDVLMEMVKDNVNEAFVVFAQSRQVIDLLVARLARANIPHVSLTGNTPQKDRGDVVARFQRGEARVFAGTVALGGVAITLTAASKMVFLDRAWSPSVNAQAEDRIHRIGQKHNVQIIDLVARNTIDLGRLSRIELKWSWVKEILGDDISQMQFRWNGRN
jgi:SNF2 family DNA or RNA helicase